MCALRLTIVILTKNESLHIRRAIESVSHITDRIVVIDSGSTDDTVSIAKQLGAEVLMHPFITQASQFNWTLSQLPDDTDWIFRLDADEIVSPELANSLATRLPNLGKEVTGVEVLRRMAFLGRPIRWGGLFPIPIIRVMRHHHGRCEDRWMDEHLIVDGDIVRLEGELLDDSLKTLTSWIDKHNHYANREAVEILDADYGFLNRSDTEGIHGGHTSMQRWLKESVYARLPGGTRAFAYFLYRYVVRLGILDGKEGAAFHILQGFWYRYLVDTKCREVKIAMRRDNSDVVTTIRDVLGIDLPPDQLTKK